MRDDGGPFIVRRESSLERDRAFLRPTEIEDEIEEAARRADIGCP
jgi:hypothetical protein